MIYCLQKLLYAGIGLGLVLAMFAFIYVHKAVASVPSSQTVAEDDHIVSFEGSLLTLSSGKIVNLYSLEIPALSSSKESAKRERYFQKHVVGKPVRMKSLSNSSAQQRNRYGDFIGSVFIGRRWLQQYLVKKGWARLNGNHPYPVEELNKLRKAEISARKKKKGLWRQPAYRVKSIEKLGKPDYQFHIVEGRPVDVVKTFKTTYINFGDNWRTDFTVAIANKNRRQFKKLGMSLKNLINEKIRIRGWVRPYNGPFMEIESWTQLEILKSQ